jgi:hypothetical protein
VEITEGTSYGNVTIYAWFQDQAGNHSTAATASAVYAYSAPTSIQHTSSSINVGATLGMTVDSSIHYNWTISPSPDGVAEFQGGETPTTLTNQHSVTVVGKAAGTFTVSAVPTANTSATPLTTVPITVVQTVKRGDVNDDGIVDSGDAILILRYSVGLTALTDTQKAAGNVTNKVSNSDIDSGDAIVILRYSVGLITAL